MVGMGYSQAGHILLAERVAVGDQIVLALDIRLVQVCLQSFVVGTVLDSSELAVQLAQPDLAVMPSPL
jgi:hypothetical protein